MTHLIYRRQVSLIKIFRDKMDKDLTDGQVL